MGALPAWLKSHMQDHAQYYRDDQEAIAAGNILTLRTTSFLTLGFLLLFLLLSPYVLPGWAPSVWHLLFVPVSAGLCVLALLFGRRGTARPAFGNALCIVYEAALYAGVLLIDAPGSPEAPATFLPLVIIALPVLFNLPFRVSYGLIALAMAGYTAAAVAFKPPLVARYDLFELTAAFFFSLATTCMTDSLRIRAYKLRLAYQRQSTRDTLLPELYNRKAFEQAARRYIDAFNPHASCAFAVVDLDNFKQINDSQGHLFGDAVLQCLGRAMQALQRPGDFVGRFGGDEFVLFAEGAVTEEGVRRRFERLCAALQEAVPPGCPVEVTCSMGMVCAGGQEVCYESLFRQADAALYEAKAWGKNTFCLAQYQSE